MNENNMLEQIEGRKKNMKPFLIILVIVLIAVAGYIFAKKSGNNPPDPDNDGEEELMSESPTPSEAMKSESPAPTGQKIDDSGAMMPDGTVKTFNITGKNFSFSEKEIQVKQGDKVKIVFTSENGVHDWVVDELNVKTGRVQSGQKSEIEFTASKKGMFEYYCSVGTHRQMGMVGKLIVE